MSAPVSVDVAIVGAGPAGIGAAVGLARRGIASTCLIERNGEAGGIPARYGDEGAVPTFVAYRRGRVMHGGAYARALLAELDGTSARPLLETQVIDVDAARCELTAVSPTRGRFEITARAIVFTTGAREQSAAERGWVAGARPARVIFTLQLVDLLRRHGALPGRRPIVLGADLIGYAAAAKLAAANAPSPMLADRSARPPTPVAARLFFRRWVRARYTGGWRGVSIQGALTPVRVTVDDGEPVACDAVVLAGSLTPNSELVVGAGLACETPRRVPVASRAGALSAPGLFAAGNVLGGFHGAEWCYWSGRRVAKAVAAYLASAR